MSNYEEIAMMKSAAEMRTVHMDEHEPARKVSEREGYLDVVCIKEDWFHSRNVGETYCCWTDSDGKYHLFASWTPDSFLAVCNPEYMKEHFAILV